MQKIFIKNRFDKKLSVIIEEGKNKERLVFIMHGLGGFKESLHTEAFAESFRKKDFTVVRFDVAHTYGESDGNYEDATITNYYEDLEDVINWSKSQAWYHKTFWLSGHSLGGFCVAMYAENHSEEIKALAPISTVVSGELLFQAWGPKALAEWVETGYRIRPSKSQPGIIKKLKYSYVEDAVKYSLMPEINRLQMPVLMIVGENDDSTPIAHQKIFFDKLPGEKEIHVIKNAPHSFDDRKHLEEIKEIFSKWIDKNLI